MVDRFRHEMTSPPILSAWKRTGLLAIPEFVARARGVLVVPLLTRFVGTPGMGIFAQSMAIATFVAPLVAFGTDTAAMRWLAGRPQREVEQGVLSLLLTQILIGFVMFGGALYVRHPLAEFLLLDRRMGLYVAVAMLLALGTAGVTTCKSLYRLTEDAANYARLSTFQCFVSIAGALGGTIVWRSVSGTIAGLVTADLLVIIVILAKLGGADLEWRPNPAFLRKVFGTGAWFLPAAYCTWIVNMADRSFLTRMRGLEQLGTYALAYSIPFSIIQLTFNPFWILYPPAAAKHVLNVDRSALNSEFQRSLNSALFVCLPLLTLATVLARPLVGIVATTAFTEGAQIIPVVGCAYLLLMVNGYYDTSLVLHGRQRWTTLALICAAAANLILNALLIPRYGIMGAASATLGAFAIQFAITVVQANKFCPLVPDIPFLTKLSVALTALFAISVLMPSAGDWLFLNAAVSLFIYIVSVLALCGGHRRLLSISLSGRGTGWKLA